jgi:hypothetical protein
MTNHDFYLNNVYPQLDLSLRDNYPHVSLESTQDHHPLAECQVVMLVALTGTGKTTTLNKLAEISNDDVSDRMKIIPSRREVADWISIPTAQVLLGEPIEHVTDRVQRFHYTRMFAEHVSGGQARAFSWINVSTDYQGNILSEGIRGENEIRYALEHCHGWQIVELALHPIIRLKRLSSRDDVFDKAEGAGDVSFLPADLQEEARLHLISGEITPKALTIMHAESKSYGLFSFTDGDAYDNYHRIDVDNLTPLQVAEKVAGLTNDMKRQNL